MSMKRLALVTTVLALVACASSASNRYERKKAQKSLLKLETPGLVIGEFKVTKITDGDTIRVDGLDSSLRLLGVDTEETFKSDGDRRAYEGGWEQYKKAKRGDSPRPVKYPTPLGQFSVQTKQVDPVWNVPNSDWAGDLAGKSIPGGDPRNPLVARWIGFNGSVGFHGTKSIDSLGRSASHGCVRMAPGDVIDLFERVEVGTPVVVA